jgi:hypothetical protein
MGRNFFEGLSSGSGFLLHHEERLIDGAVGLRRNDDYGLSHAIVASVRSRQRFTAIHGAGLKVNSGWSPTPTVSTGWPCDTLDIR